jgi:hypothetical protein
LDAVAIIAASLARPLQEMLSNQQLCDIAHIFEQNNVGLVNFIISLVDGPKKDQKFNKALIRLYDELCSWKNLNKMLAAFLDNSKTSEIVLRLARNATTHQYIHELDGALKKSEGFHANASHMTIEKVLHFSRSKMAESLEEKCPTLWQLLQLLLNATVARTAIKRLEDSEDYYTQLVPEASTQTEIAGGSSIADSAASEDKARSGQEWNLGQGRRSTNKKAKTRQIELAEVVSILFMHNRERLLTFRGRDV